MWFVRGARVLGRQAVGLSWTCSNDWQIGILAKARLRQQEPDGGSRGMSVAGRCTPFQYRQWRLLLPNGYGNSPHWPIFAAGSCSCQKATFNHLTLGLFD